MKQTTLPDGVKRVEIRALKPGDFFTLKPILQPSERQVWVMDGYDRVTKIYEAHYFDDVKHDHPRGFRERHVYVGFIF